MSDYHAQVTLSNHKFNTGFDVVLWSIRNIGSDWSKRVL